MLREFKIVRLLSVFFGLLLSGYVPAGSQTAQTDILLLTGEWIITSQTASPLVMNLICKPILKGTTFTFKENTLKVYTDLSKKPCNIYSFKIMENTISFIKEDMIWFCTYKLKGEKLELKSYNFFVQDTPNDLVPLTKQPSEQQVVVTLIKKK